MSLHLPLEPLTLHRYEAPAELLAHQTLLITGAAGALGSAIALQAAELGSELILLDKNERALNALYDEILQRSDIEAGLYPLDLGGATVDDYHTLARTIETEFKGLNGLIHCAAEVGQLAPLTNLDAAQWQKTLTANLHGPVLLTTALLPLMRQSAPASIVFTADTKCKAYWNSYAASKAGITAVAGALSDELDADRDNAGNLQVTCNAVHPALMRSALRRSAFPGEDPASVPTAESNVPAYLYLLSEDARDVNGKMIDMRDSCAE